VRQDVDRLMQQRGLAGMVVFANDRYCPAMYYAAGRKFHRAIYFRAADGRAHLIADPMERDDAAKAGVEYSTLPQHRWTQRIDAYGPAGGHADLIAEMLATLGIKGKIAFFGDLEASFAYELLHQLMARADGITIDRLFPDLLTQARATKDKDEIAAIRRASTSVVRAYGKLREHLATLERDGDHFKNGAGIVTLGSLRTLLHREFLADELEGGESIVSQGRDAGVPHNRGNDAEPLRAGAPVIVDIFPGEAGGGYHSDFTRTFCMGKAPEPLKRLYDDCHAAFREVMDTLEVGATCRSYQEKTCDVFEARGHATVRSNQGTEEGYVHGLGHGVGLAVHEAPRLGGPPSNTQTLEPGMVVTIEPGLYYPSRGMGVRIEDLVVMKPDGGYENLTQASYDLEIGSRA
jgi:Xaa-Pro aminopeptidase